MQITINETEIREIIKENVKRTFNLDVDTINFTLGRGENGVSATIIPKKATETEAPLNDLTQKINEYNNSSRVKAVLDNSTSIEQKVFEQEQQQAKEDPVKEPEKQEESPSTTEDTNSSDAPRKSLFSGLAR